MDRLLFCISLLFLTGCGSVESSGNNKTSGEFEWDFSEPKKIIYSFSQTSNISDLRDQEGLIDEHFFTAIGELTIKVKENNLADLIISSLEIKSVDKYAGSQMPADTTSDQIPLSVLQDMNSKGKFNDSNNDMSFGMLFQVPSKSLKIGDSCAIPMQFPFNANGSRLYVKGQNTLTLVRYEELKGRNCAVLEGVIDVSQMDIPEELTGEYEVSNTGNATYYFDLEDGLFVGSDITVVLKAFMDSKVEGDQLLGMFMETTTENVYKIRLKKIGK